MKRRITRVAIVTMGVFVLLCLVPSVGLRSVSASTQVSVNVNIGPPPPVIVYAPPTMVYLPEPAAYVAVGIPYDIFFVSGRYYYFYGTNWFWADGYGGPWVYVSYNSLPPGLRKYKVERLYEFRQREYEVYKVQGPAFKGRHFEAAESKHDSRPGRGNGNNGRGKGKKDE